MFLWLTFLCIGIRQKLVRVYRIAGLLSYCKNMNTSFTSEVKKDIGYKNYLQKDRQSTEKCFENDLRNA